MAYTGVCWNQKTRVLVPFLPFIIQVIFANHLISHNLSYHLVIILVKRIPNFLSILQRPALPTLMILLKTKWYVYVKGLHEKCQSILKQHIFKYSELERSIETEKTGSFYRWVNEWPERLNNLFTIVELFGRIRLPSFFFFNWRIIALQNFVVFCQTSTWISHRYTYIPSLLNLPPISLPIPAPPGWYRAPVWVSWATQQIPAGYLFYTW